MVSTLSWPHRHVSQCWAPRSHAGGIKHATPDESERAALSTVLFGFLREDEEAAAFFRGQQRTIKQVTVTMIPKPNE